MLCRTRQKRLPETRPSLVALQIRLACAGRPSRHGDRPSQPRPRWPASDPRKDCCFALSIPPYLQSPTAPKGGMDRIIPVGQKTRSLGGRKKKNRPWLKLWRSQLSVGVTGKTAVKMTKRGGEYTGDNTSFIFPLFFHIRFPPSLSLGRGGGWGWGWGWGLGSRSTTAVKTSIGTAVWTRRALWAPARLKGGWLADLADLADWLTG